MFSDYSVESFFYEHICFLIRMLYSHFDHPFWPNSSSLASSNSYSYISLAKSHFRFCEKNDLDFLNLSIVPVAFLDFLLMFTTLGNLEPTPDPPFRALCGISSRQSAELGSMTACEQVHAQELFHPCNDFVPRASYTLQEIGRKEPEEVRVCQGPRQNS